MPVPKFAIERSRFSQVAELDAGNRLIHGARLSVRRQYPSGAANSTRDATDAAVQAACALHPNAERFTSMKGWRTGTAKARSTTGSGRPDLFTSSSSLHPTYAGQNHHGKQIAHFIAA
jgi:hypothetical protein